MFVDFSEPRFKNLCSKTCHVCGKSCSVIHKWSRTVIYIVTIREVRLNLGIYFWINNHKSGTHGFYISCTVTSQIVKHNKFAISQYSNMTVYQCVFVDCSYCFSMNSLTECMKWQWNYNLGTDVNLHLLRDILLYWLYARWVIYIDTAVLLYILYEVDLKFIIICWLNTNIAKSGLETCNSKKL